MTTNDATLRERIADVLYNLDGCSFEEQAFRVMETYHAHLWQAADDPAVVDKVAQEQATRAGCLGTMTVTMHPLAVDKFRADARYDIQRVLTAMIGPRPTEQETK